MDNSSNPRNSTPRVFVDGRELAVETVPVAALTRGDLVAPAGSVNDGEIKLHTLRRVLRRDGYRLTYGAIGGQMFNRNFSPATQFHRVTGADADQLIPLESVWDQEPQPVELPAYHREDSAEQDLHRILQAWTVPGPQPQPQYHRDSQESLRRIWPTLASALDNAARIRQ